MGFLSYIGGKHKLAKSLIALIPVHECYIEVFCGAAWLYFKKPKSKIEIINDINSDLITLYRVVQNHLSAFADCLKWSLTSRAEYDRLRTMNTESMTDIQRAVRFYYLIRNTFAAKLEFSSFNVSTTKPPKINPIILEQDLEQVRERLAQTFVENRHYSQIVTKYADKPEVFLYLDPPYYECENYYGNGIFSRADYQKISDMLVGAKSKFLISINDAPEIRRIFKRYNIQEVATRYHAGNADKNKVVTELTIMNYDPSEVQLAYSAV